MRLTYSGTTVGSYFLKGGLLELLNHLSPAFLLLFLYAYTVHWRIRTHKHTLALFS